MFRELCDLLEIPILPEPGITTDLAACLRSPTAIALHGAGPGAVRLRLPTAATLTDLLDPRSGWQDTRTLEVPLSRGETRVLVME